MSVHYRLLRCNIKSSKNYGKYYARATMLQEVDMQTLARRIQARCSLTEADATAAIIALEHEVRQALHDGCKVNLGELGSFSLGIKSDMVDCPADFNTQRHIHGFTCHYTPCGHRSRIEDRTLVRPFTEGCKAEPMDEE